MIPGISNLKEIEMTMHPSLCYRMLLDTGRISGLCDGADAVKQAVYNILNVERYQYIIFSWNYGVELQDLFGKPMDYVMSEVKRRITEALTQDDRIESVDDFSFEVIGREKLHVTFTVHSIYGRFEAIKEVEV